jgi:osmotically-inducible protein OsmY
MIMKSNDETEHEVREALLWEPALTGADVQAKIHDGAVILSGKVTSYTKKALAEKIVRRIPGVRKIDNELQIVQLTSFRKPDLELEKTIEEIFKWSSTVDASKVSAAVKNGWVTLEGEVENGFVKAKAARLIEDLEGVQGITNKIGVQTKDSVYKETVIQEKIVEAFNRNYYLDSNKINVEVVGDTVLLSGEVNTLAEVEEAERASLSAPGINKVENKLIATHAEVWA